MKKILSLVTVLTVGVLFSGVCGQTKSKFAHVNSAELMKIMPGVDTAQKVIQDYAKQLEDEGKAMYSEYERKVMDFQNNQPTMSLSLQDVKRKEIQDLEGRLRNFEEQAQSELQEKQEELLTPLIDKAKAAIADVAKEHGYSYVFDSSMGVMLYSDPGDDIIELVKKKLNITK